VKRNRGPQKDAGQTSGGTEVSEIQRARNEIQLLKGLKAAGEHGRIITAQTSSGGNAFCLSFEIAIYRDLRLSRIVFWRF
jgi:hypothetical protein